MNSSLELGTILARMPSDFRLPGRISNIALAYSCGWANLLWNRRHAVRVAFRANMELAEGYGSGNRAARRVKARRGA
jgi:hypothetical protein